MKQEVSERLFNRIHDLFCHESVIANKKIGNTEAQKFDNVVHEDGGYKCILLSHQQFLRMLESVIRNEKLDSDLIRSRKLFLDIGCGVGEKVFLAKLYGFSAYGLELRKALITEARRIFNMFGWYPPSTFIHGDALTYNYSKFDVLYFYCPLFQKELQQKLEDRIVETAKPGAVVIPAMPRGKFCGYEIAGWMQKSPPDSYSYYVKK